MHIAIIAGRSLEVVSPSLIPRPHAAERSGDPQSPVLFYDWLSGADGRVCGVELHIGRKHALAQALHGRPYVTFDPYPRLWFTPEKLGSPRGLEAFGDIDVFEIGGDDWCVVVSSEWLTAGDCEALQAMTVKPR